MKHAMLTLDYFALSKEAKALKTSSDAKVDPHCAPRGLRHPAPGDDHARHRRKK